MMSRTGGRDGRLLVRAGMDGTGFDIVLRGEADVTTVDDLRVVLSEIRPDGAREVRLDVSHLEFVDVAALRHLTIFATRLRDAGHEVRTRGARPALAHLIRVCGVDATLGLDGE